MLLSQYTKNKFFINCEYKNDINNKIRRAIQKVKITYTRRQFIKTVGFGAAGLAITGCSGIQNLLTQQSYTKTNIVLIMADDMGYSDIGCYGGEINTPNINSLASKGLRFSQFYNTARCCPTRASLLTGLHPHQAGLGWMTEDNRGLEGYQGELNNKCVTIAEVLKSAGYSTYMSGKWHVAKNLKNEGPKYNWPCQRGFDRFYGTIIGAGSFYHPTILARDNELIEPDGKGYYYTDAITDNAINFIRAHNKKDSAKPFFLYVAYTSPHWPLHALEEDIKKYKGRFDAGWDSLRKQRQKRMIDMGLIDEKWKLSRRDPRVKAWKEAEHKEWETRRMEVYAAQVDRMDQGIGKIINTLKETENFENTLIIFLSDNGGCAEEVTESWEPWILEAPVGTKYTWDGREVRFGKNPNIMPGPEDTYQSYGIPWANVSNTPFRLYKHWIHEGGISTPLIIHWPGHISKPGSITHQYGQLTDIMATCVDVTEAKYPDVHKDNKVYPVEGRSLRPAFAGNKMKHSVLYWEHEGNRGVREGKWKLVAKGQDGKWELYDIEADRTENNDLAEQYHSRVKIMEQMYVAWAYRTKVLPNRKERDTKI